MIMIHLQLCGFFVVLLRCFFSRALAVQVGGDYQCSPWKDGEKVTITFRIDRSKFPSLCDAGSVNGRPLFSMSTGGGAAYTTSCTVADDIRVPGNCNFPSGKVGCGCTAENDNGYYVVEYNFVAGPSFNRWWKASANCLDSGFNTVLSFTDIYCQPIPEVTTTTTTTVVPMSTTDTSTSTGTETSISMSTNSSSPTVSSQNTTATAGTEHNNTSIITDSQHKYVAVYVGVGFVGLVVIIACCVVLVLRRRKAKTETVNSDRLPNGATIPNDTRPHRRETHM